MSMSPLCCLDTLSLYIALCCLWILPLSFSLQRYCWDPLCCLWRTLYQTWQFEYAYAMYVCGIYMCAQHLLVSHRAWGAPDVGHASYAGDVVVWALRVLLAPAMQSPSESYPFPSPCDRIAIGGDRNSLLYSSCATYYMVNAISFCIGLDEYMSSYEYI